MTYSIGFRAPSRGELIDHWSEQLVADMLEDDRYADPGLQPQANPGELSAEAIARLHDMVTDTLGDRDAFARWFGRYSSEPKYPDADREPEEPADIEDLRERFAEGEPLARNPASRFSFIRQPGDALLLFVDGSCFECAGDTAALAERICASDSIPVGPDLAASDEAMALIVALIDQGSLGFDTED
jgi:50S ribosomal protein L16 3-hydroxylase